MAVNRFTTITPSKFNPLSYNEIMATAQMQRARHDNLTAQQELLRQGLAKVDPLDVHFNEALKLKTDINDQINSQAELLAKEGVNPNSTSNFIKLNRQYNDLMSPTGRLGQINQAKQVYNKQLSDYIEDATKNKGWSREVALQNWKNNVQKPYTGFDANNNIINVGSYGAPKKVETLEKLKAVKDLLGEQVVKEIGNNNFNIQAQPDGSVILVDGSGRRIETSNKPNIEYGLKLLQQQMQDPEWRSSMQFEGINPNAVNNEIIYGVNAMLKNDVKDNRDTNYSLHGYKNPNEKEDTGAFGLIENQHIFTPDNLTGSTYQNNNGRLETLNGKINNLTPAEQNERNQLEVFQNKVDQKLSSDKQYSTVVQKYNNEKKYVTDQIRNYFKNHPSTEGGKADPEAMVKSYLNGNTSIINALPAEVRKRSGDLIKLNNQREDIRDEYTKENHLEEYGYTLIPESAKQETALELASKALFDNARANPENLLNYQNIESVDVAGSPYSKLTVNDKKNIAKLLSESGDRNSFRIVSTIPKTSNGKPGYIVEFNTSNGSNYNLDGVKFGDDNVGGDKAIRLKLTFNNVQGNVAKNINGYLQEFMSGKGNIDNATNRPLGTDLSNSVRKNTYNNGTWSQYMGDNSWARDGYLVNQMKSIIEESLNTDGNNSPFKGAKNEQEMISRFQQLYGNQKINP